MTAPWLAPDGRPWGETRPGHRILAPRDTVHWVSLKRAPGFVPPRKTRTAIAARHLCTGGLRPGRLGKSTLWRLGWAPWEF